MRIAILDDYQQVAVDLADWSMLGAEVQAFSEHVADEPRLVSVLSSFDVIVAMRERTPFPREVLEQLPALRLLVTTGMRNASIDVEAARDLGVVVSGTRGLPYPTAELTFALILALARGIVPEVLSVRSGGWQVGLGRDLFGSTLGVVGLGELGTRVAGLGSAFGMNVVAWSQNLSAERAEGVGVSAVTKEELLEASDFVSIHLKLSERTHRLIDSDELALMKPTAYMINTSRGQIVDEGALVSAVRDGVIAGAAMDVFDEEPLPPDHPFRREPRIITTPHVGFVTRQTYEIFYQDAVDAIRAWQDGRPIRVLD